MFQETGLGSMENTALKAEFPQWDCYYSNLEKGRAGVLTMVRKTVNKKYTVTKVELPRAAAGRVLVLHMHSKDTPGADKASFNLVNVYLSSGQGAMGEKLEQISALTKVDARYHTVVGGDFNFVENASDCTGHIGNNCLTGEARAAWKQTCVRLRLVDTEQELHTRFQKGGANASSSRLDRFYTSITKAELTLVRVRAYPIFAGAVRAKCHASLHERIASGETVVLVSPLSDHLPVGLDMEARDKQNQGPSDMPAWAALVPGFMSKVQETIKTGVKRHTAFEELDRWKQAIRSVYKKLVKGKRAVADAYGGQVAKLTKAVGLLHRCSRVAPDHDRIREDMDAHPYLAGKVRLASVAGVELGHYDTVALEAFIDSLYGEGLAESAVAGDAAGTEGLRPAAYLPGTGGGFNLMSELKSQLPSSRTRLEALRPSPGQPASSDPLVLNSSVSGFWGKVWEKQVGGATGGQVSAYLRDYNKHVNPALLHGVPGMEYVEDVIRKTQDSCAGPDGIPFSFYREDCKVGGTVSALLHGVLVALAAGKKGPAAFNKARLFLIAKTDSLLVQDTRPISVTDASNRVVASCLAEAITPALQEFIEASQKGFVPGRVGTEHVHGLCGQFYSSLAKNKQLYLLSLDTARAFDSISHDYIRRLLKHIGLPLWVCAMVDGLLHEVTVLAAIAGAAATPIPIKRGVKQGCPLSPLLFVLCYDVLLWRLAKLRGVTAYGYADDLALTTADEGKLMEGLDLIKAFSEVSGLGLNMKKTFVVSVRPMPPALRARLDRRGWGAVKSAPSCTYLGVMVGPDVSTREVFAKATAKFMSRLAQYSPMLRTASMHTRIVVANVFLLPLMWYLCQFYICPYDTVVLPIQRALHRMIVPFRGTAFAYAHLLRPREAGGPFVPLKDVWATNVAMLAATYDLEDSEGQELPAMGYAGHVHHPLTQWKGRAMDNCMTTEGHAAYCAFVVLEDHAPRQVGGRLDLGRLPRAGLPAKRRAYIYRLLADTGYAAARSSPAKGTSLDNKIGKFVPGPGQGRLLVAQAGAVARKLTPAVWNTQLRLTYNALPFDCRRESACMDPTRRNTSGVGSPFPCYFCGEGEDSTKHVFGECKVVRKARRGVARLVGCNLDDSMRTTLLAFPVVDNPAVALAIVCFNWAVWTERTQFLQKIGYTPSPDTVANRICARARRRIPVGDGSKRARGEAEVAAFARQPPPMQPSGSPTARPSPTQAPAARAWWCAHRAPKSM